MRLTFVIKPVHLICAAAFATAIGVVQFAALDVERSANSRANALADRDAEIAQKDFQIQSAEAKLKNWPSFPAPKSRDNAAFELDVKESCEMFASQADMVRFAIKSGASAYDAAETAKDKLRPFIKHRVLGHIPWYQSLDAIAADIATGEYKPSQVMNYAYQLCDTLTHKTAQADYVNYDRFQLP